MWRILHRADSVLERLAWVPSLVLLLALVIVVVQMADRRVPFEIVHVEPAFARAGEPLVIMAKVRRDTSRNCNATMSRYVFDANDARWDYPVSTVSAALIARMERDTPGQLKAAIVVPHGAATGPAELVSVLLYRCNRAHTLWPVEVTTRMPFVILP